MSGTTSVPRPVWTDQGFVAPAEADVLAGVQADMNAAFGGNLNTALETPQGQLGSSLTAIVGDKNSQFLFYTQQVDPAFASGRMQDGIARIYFITRLPALPTVVTATCVGLANVVIPAGATAEALDGNLYVCTSAATIPLTGTVDVQFACVTNGPIPCPAGTLTRPYRTIPGWDTINNAADGVLGSNVETRAAFEARRQQSVAKNSTGMLSSVLGSVLGVTGVSDAYVVENPAATAATIGGISIAAHSLYIAAVGGTNTDVATAIFNKKAPGCSYTPGNTTVVVPDNNPAYSPPFPQYSVQFTRPAPLDIKFSVTIINSTAVPSNALAQIQAAILSAFVGGDGGPRARIGSTILGSRYYGPVIALGSWAQVVTVQVGTGGAFGNSVATTIAQVPTTSAPDITLTLV